MAYIGSSPTKVVSRQSANIFTYTATANQTAFTGSDANGNTLACTPSDIMVHMNGLRLEESDFTATTTTVTLGSGAAAGDEVTITAFVTFETADAYTKSASDTRYVNVTGDSMTGNLGVNVSPTAALDVRRSDTNGKIAEFHQSSGYGFELSSSTSLATLSSGYNQDWSFTTDAGSGAVERMRLLAGGGLTFNGDTAAANALDDYEEGTFNVTFGGATVSVGSNVANYTKIGNMVYWRYYTGASTISSSSGSLIMGGLPYNVANVHGNYSGINVGLNTFFGSSVTDGQKAYHQINTDYIYFVNPSTISSPAAVNGSSKYLMVGGFYQAA